MESFRIERNVVMQRFHSFEDMLAVLESFIQFGGKIRLKVEQDWTTEIIAGPKDGTDDWCFKWAGLQQFPLCIQSEKEKFQLINQLRGKNWIQDLEDAINSGDTTDHLKRVLKLRAFE